MAPMSQAASRDQVEDDERHRRFANGRTSEELIARHVEPHPGRPGLSEWRLKERGVPVWAIIGALILTDNPAENPGVLDDQVVAALLTEEQAVEQVARDYGVSREAVEGAIAYYWRCKHLIDARLISNAD